VSISAPTCPRSGDSPGEPSACARGRGRGTLSYIPHLSKAPGTKVGGWVDWIQHPQWPDCTAGHRAEHLLTISSWECDGASWRTWLPAEDRAATVRAAAADLSEPLPESAVKPTGLRIGDAGSL
jgi:hypothetical protein